MLVRRYTKGANPEELTFVIFGGNQPDLLVTPGAEDLHENSLLGAGTVHGAVQLLRQQGGQRTHHIPDEVRRMRVNEGGTGTRLVTLRVGHW